MPHEQLTVSRKSPRGHSEQAPCALAQAERGGISIARACGVRQSGTRTANASGTRLSANGAAEQATADLDSTRRMNAAWESKDRSSATPCGANKSLRRKRATWQTARYPANVSTGD
eukprot:5210354-Pleurochrysis_carterae.AAC.1